MVRLSRVILALLTLAAALVLGLAARPAFGAPDCGTRTFSVYFEEWKSDLTPEARQSLDLQQRSFRGCAIRHVRIVGLAGAPGPADRNQVLSGHRAKTIADTLVSGGWPRERLELISRGDKNAKKGDLDKPVRRRVQVTVEARPA
jgi:outer membrane protein OmpA-like peptidoglycan-associated protein